MNIKRFTELYENFEPVTDFVTTVNVSFYGLPEGVTDVEIENGTAKIHWNCRIMFGKDNFSFDIWVSKVVVECVWNHLDIEGEVVKEEDKEFVFDSEQITGSRPDEDNLRYDIRPSEVEIHYHKGKSDVEVCW